MREKFIVGLILLLAISITIMIFVGIYLIFEGLYWVIEYLIEDELSRTARTILGVLIVSSGIVLYCYLAPSNSQKKEREEENKFLLKYYKDPPLSRWTKVTLWIDQRITITEIIAVVIAAAIVMFLSLQFR